jgi:hypothetical protein
MKIGSKLSKRSDSFTVNIYDNGYMLEISGKDKKDDWKTAKVNCSTKEELFEYITELLEIDQDD